MNSIDDYYNQGREQNRLLQGGGQLEYVRTQSILQRYLPKPPSTVLDIGGGAGIYAFPLAELGYQVHLRDITPLHIEQALAVQTPKPLASIQLGDARQLDFENESADAVLLLGPLYHLTDGADRLQALKEAHRVLKPQGIVIGATISRFASLYDGLARGFLSDDYFTELVETDLQTGQHRNPKGLPGYFTTAYFHYPTQTKDEFQAAGFEVEKILAVEGLGNAIPNFDEAWQNENFRERLLHFLSMVEDEPTLLGASGHIITIGRK